MINEEENTNENKINTRPTHLRIIIEDDDTEDNIANTVEQNTTELEEEEDAEDAEDEDEDQDDEEEEEAPSFPKRHGFRWSNSEIDALYCEFEIRKYDIHRIAERHQRTCSAILCKLQSENLIDNLRWNEETQEYEYEARYMTISDEWDDETGSNSNSDSNSEDEEGEEEEEGNDDDDDVDDEEKKCEDYDITTFSNYKPTAFDNILFAYYDRVNNMIDNIGTITSNISNGISYIFG